MSDPIVYIDTSKIRDGRLQDVKAAATQLTAYVEANNPHILSYRFFIDDKALQMVVVAVHPSSAALEFHMRMGEEAFREFSDLVDLSSITVYGDVSDAVRRQLREKAQMLGNGGVAIFSSHAGFAR